MIEDFSPAGRAALAELKAFIRSNVSTAALDERALMLVGLPNVDIDEGIAAFCRELSECFVSESMPETFRSGSWFHDIVSTDCRISNIVRRSDNAEMTNKILAKAGF